MDVRRQARLTAALPITPTHPHTLPRVHPLPVPYLPPVFLAPPPLPVVAHGEDTARFGAGMVAGGGQGTGPIHRVARRVGVGDSRFVPGVAEPPIRKDRRKDRHKRASDGRNPMIRLNPATADRFFAVQRLLESKRLKKTSGSFVINWLIDVAHASIQAVLDQGEAETEASEQQQPPGSSVQCPARQLPEDPGGKDDPAPSDLALVVIQQDQDQLSGIAPAPGPLSQGPGTFLSAEHLQPQHLPESVGQGQGSFLAASGRLGRSHGGGLFSVTPNLSSTGGGEEPSDEEEVSVEDDEPSRQVHAERLLPGQAHSVQMYQGQGHPRHQGQARFDPRYSSHFLFNGSFPLQRDDVNFGQMMGQGHHFARGAYSAADIARTAMAAAEAAEAEGDDEDEEVDVVADGDGDSEDPLALRQPGGTHSVVWMRSGRSYPPCAPEPGLARGQEPGGKG